MWLMLPVVAGMAALVLCPGGAASSDMERKAVVAPIFEHGPGRVTTSGRGSRFWGKIVLLSDEEAREIIREELEQAGITDIEPNKELPELQDISSVHYNAKFYADLYSPSLKIAMEFISSNDDGSLVPRRRNPCRGCGHTYKFKQTAKLLNEKVTMLCSDMYFVSFYDPGLKVSDYIPISRNSSEKEERQRAANTVKQVAKSLLRSQVQDFVQWFFDNRYLSEVPQ